MESDAHGIYLKRVCRASLLPNMTEGIARMIVIYVAGGDAWDAWHRDGMVIVGGLFGWLWEGISYDGEVEEGIGPLIDQEFRIYLYY